MPHVERTRRAKTDAVQIWAYIAERNHVAADELIDRIDERLAMLATIPESAEAVPYIAPDVRRSSVGHYVIYFRPIENGIHVLRILHGARQPEDVV
ncbi:MAG: type II toxin-antitoxin system RelE/ParE family toxin [Pirellulaceae bacterium]|jgi:toxin ParE1/3/4|nr:type II toxin-antitoxin system RelE/ParE family toxin [Pirellulaceae bacterium]